MLVEHKGYVYVRVTTILARQFGFKNSTTFREFLTRSSTIDTVVEKLRPDDPHERATYM